MRKVTLINILQDQYFCEVSFLRIAYSLKESLTDEVAVSKNDSFLQFYERILPTDHSEASESRVRRQHR